jgi:hypothetical protein
VLLAFTSENVGLVTEVAVQGNRQNIGIEFDAFNQIEQFHCVLNISVPGLI